jgi:hypothetical protein
MKALLAGVVLIAAAASRADELPQDEAPQIAVADTSRGWQPPSRTETMLLVGAEALIAADCWLTVDAVHHGLGEDNPILGLRPSAGRVAAFCGLAAIGTAASWYLLPSPWRNIVSLSVAIIETGATASNVMAGARLRF